MWVCSKFCCFFSCFGISSGPSKYKICNTWPSWCFADSDNLLKGQGFGSACLKHSDMVEQRSGQHVVDGGKCLCAACPWDKDFMWLENLSGLSSRVLVTSSAWPMIIAALVEVRHDLKIRCFTVISNVLEGLAVWSILSQWHAWAFRISDMSLKQYPWAELHTVL